MHSYYCFQGVTVYAPSYVLNQSEIVVMFQSGAGLEVLENKGFMTTRVYLPWQFIVSLISSLLQPLIYACA